MKTIIVLGSAVIQIALVSGCSNAPASADASMHGMFDASPVFADQVAPTPSATWVNVTHNLAGMASECGNVSALVSHPATDMLITDVAQHGLWASTDGAASWHALGSGSGSAPITNRASTIVFDPTNPQVFYESGIYNGTGVYRTDNNGSVFLGLGDSHHIDAVSIDFADPQRQTLVAGGHEQQQTLYRSTNAGSTWTNIGTNLPGGTNFCTQPLVLDHQTYLVGCSGWGGGTDGIFRTTDSGMNWQQVSTVSPTNQPLWASDASIYWALTNNHGLARSTDQGLTWTQVGGAGVVAAVHPVELPDHRIATAGVHGMVVSADHGATWTSASDPIPFDPTGIAYSAPRRAFYAFHFDCNNNVPNDAIMQFGFDYSQP